jgi:hypothetical protein
VSPKRRPGRPPIDEDDDSVRVSITLPAKHFDSLCRQALRDDISVPEVIRRELAPRQKTLQKP